MMKQLWRAVLALLALLIALGSLSVSTAQAAQTTRSATPAVSTATALPDATASACRLPALGVHDVAIQYPVIKGRPIDRNLFWNVVPIVGPHAADRSFVMNDHIGNLVTYVLLRDAHGQCRTGEMLVQKHYQWGSKVATRAVVTIPPGYQAIGYQIKVVPLLRPTLARHALWIQSGNRLDWPLPHNWVNQGTPTLEPLGNVTLAHWVSYPSYKLGAAVQYLDRSGNTHVTSDYSRVKGVPLDVRVPAASRYIIDTLVQGVPA